MMIKTRGGTCNVSEDSTLVVDAERSVVETAHGTFTLTETTSGLRIRAYDDRLQIQPECSNVITISEAK